jgi:hypothetical protein
VILSKRSFILAAAALAFAAGCGAPAEGDLVPDWALGVPARTLAVVDSIGLEMGDSSYVFGQIAGVAWTPDGEIAVLDLKRCTILFYDADGNYVRSLGRQGSGPGEFLLPSAMAFRESDGSLSVADAMAAKVHFFDSTGASTGGMEGFFPTVPIQITAVDSAGLIGLKPDFEHNDQGMFMGFTLARWEGVDIEPSVVYHSEMNPFDPMDMASSMAGMFYFAAGPDGRVFRAPMSSEGYLVEGYEPDGTMFLTIERTYDPVLKTEEEIADEKAFVEERMAASGTPPEMISWEPETVKASIAGLLLDEDGNLWVRRGWVDGAVFDVFDMEGTLLFTATVEYPGSTDYWSVVSGEEGFLAFDSNPETWAPGFMLALT